MKTALVTGAGRGIGLELTRQLLESGAHVWAAVREPEKSNSLKQLQKDFSKQLSIVACDVTSDSSVESMAKKIGPGVAIDLLINNAGVLLEYDKSLEDLSIDKIRESFEINTIGPLRVLRAVLPNLRRAGAAKVVNMTSLMGSIGDNTSGGSYAYRMSKAALNMLTKSLSIDEKFISIVMHPGWVKTEMGGAGAKTEIRDSVKGILGVIEGLKMGDSGRFFEFRGRGCGW